MVIHTWKCLLSRLMLCDSHIMESPWASSPKTYKPMSSFVRPCSTPALCTWLKFQSSRRGFGCKAGICCWNDAICLSWETLKLGWQHAPSPAKNVHHIDRQIEQHTCASIRIVSYCTHMRDDISWYNLMKHIFYAFPRSALEMEGKFFWNVFNRWLLESRGYTLLVWVCVCELAEATIH